MAKNNKYLKENCDILFNVLESVIPKNTDVVVIYSGIWSFANIFKMNPKIVSSFILDCIDKFIDDKTTIIFPSFYASQFVKTKSYDLSLSLPKESGLLSIEALKTEEYARTHNPLHSYLIKGPMRNDVMALDSSTSWGKDSILSWMVDQDALICPLGIDWHSGCSLFHIIEEDLQVPYRYFKRFSGEMFNNGKFVSSCSEVKYSYPLNVTLELDYSIATKSLKKNFKVLNSPDNRIFMQSASAKDILSASRMALDDDIFAYVKNKDDALNWIKNYKEVEILSLSKDQKYVF
jgi:aminoglycoside N3'-acetyltransferase